MKENNLGRMLFRGLFLFAAGVAVGILTAPKTGRGTRAWLGQKAAHLENLSMRWTGRLESQARYEEGKLAGTVHKVKQLALARTDNETRVDDDIVTQRIRTQIGENAVTRQLPRINVDTCDGVVTLRGRVDSNTQRQALEEIAESDSSVENVINKITVARRRAAS